MADRFRQFLAPSAHTLQSQRLARFRSEISALIGIVIQAIKLLILRVLKVADIFPPFGAETLRLRDLRMVPEMLTEDFGS
jgi:hypothetical protein